MKKIILLMLLMPGFASADQLKHAHWSYGCDMYIYVFDIGHNRFKVYSRIDAHDAALGSYTAYLLTEGNLEPVKKSVYMLSGKDFEGDAEVNFSDPEMVIMQSQQYGYAALSPCDSESALELIQDAEKYFESCPKDVIKKCL